MSKETEGTYAYHRRKADQAWEMAGLARRDRDYVDAERQTQIAKEHERLASEAKS